MFVEYTEEQYRSIDQDELEERRSLILSLAENPDTDSETVAKLDGESKRCMAEFDRREQAAQLRAKRISEVRGGAGSVVAASKADEPEEDPFDTAEYRKAFMDYVCKRKAMPEGMLAPQQRVDAVTQTSDVSPMVPTTMGREIVKKMSEYGTIWNKVRKLTVKGGLWFRVLDLKPTATWVDEDETSDYQKAEADDKVSFSFYQLECRMSQTLLASAVTFDDFQAMFVPAVAEAMVRALETAILTGAGTAGPLGITKDTRVTNVVEMTAEDFSDWKQWRKKVKAAIPKSYRHGGFTMAQSTFDSYVETMSDDSNAPVSIGYNPVTGEEVQRLMGFGVDTVEDALPDFDTASAGDVVAIYGDWSDYVVNTQPGMPMSTVRWVDHENNQEKIKALMACDGKVLDPHGFVLIKKKASSTGDDDSGPTA